MSSSELHSGRPNAAGPAPGLSDADVGKAVEAAVACHETAPDRLLPLLLDVQDRIGYLPESALRLLAAKTGIPPARIFGVATFYDRFRLEPTGKYEIRVCHGTACHVAGAPEITAAVRRRLGLDEDRNTTEDGLFTVRKVACLGCCSLAPVMQIDTVTYGHLTPGMIEEVISDFLERTAGAERRKRRRRPPPAIEDVPVFRVGIGSCCVAAGSGAVREAIEDEIKRLQAAAIVKPGGCIGLCHRVPIVEVYLPDGRVFSYSRVTPDLARAIVRRHVTPEGLAGRLRYLAGEFESLLQPEAPGIRIESARIHADEGEVRAFLARQRAVVLEHAGRVDPVDIEEYRRTGGFQALERMLEGGAPEDVIEIIRESGLRGRGGAGFPTARKWQTAREATGRPKFIICNGDEGDPGAFMDRMILESYPFRVIEGMLLAAYAIGADHGIVYVRAEYPVAVRHVRAAIEAVRRAGLLGDDICGTGFAFDIEVREGAGAFVSGEETALIAAIEGRRGAPRLRPPYPAVNGLFGSPTVINNVETFACVPWIVRHGAEAFAALGTERSRGTKVFALAGRVRRGGLIEVPMGITITEIVDEIGGGIRDGRLFKAVQIGGPSGGCIPAWLGHTTVDYEALTKRGAIMGSGGLVVMDDRTCMVDMARFFLQFTQNESCGKCTFCRIGTRRMLEILDRLCTGKGQPGDLEQLEDLGKKVKAASLCGLGRTAPNPVLTTLRYFRDEYEAHLEGRCPAGVCPDLITFRITDRCIGCTICAQHCPADAIEPEPYQVHTIDVSKCIRCGTCRRVCPEDAVTVE